jgi:hypothetical protein
MQPYEDNRDPAVPPEVERRLRGLSQPGPGGDAYVIPPPPARTGPDVSGVGARVVETGGRVADAGLAAVAHFAIFFGFLGVGFLLSVAISVGIWLYSRRSPFVAYQAEQAGCYQVFVLVFNLGCAALLGVFLAGQIYWGWTWAGTAAALLIVFFIAWFPLSILYGLWGGLQVLLGRDFRYPVLGNWAARKRDRAA